MDYPFNKTGTDRQQPLSFLEDHDNEASSSAKAAASFRSPPSSNKKRPLGTDFVPGEYTVLCGRGSICAASSGNSHLKKIVESVVTRYSNAKSKTEKSAIVSSIIIAVKNASPQAGFIKFEEGQWWEVEDAFAREKIGCLFRDCLHSKYRSSTKSKLAARRLHGAPVKETKTREDDAGVPSASSMASSSLKNNEQEQEEGYQIERGTSKGIETTESRDSSKKRPHSADYSKATVGSDSHPTGSPSKRPLLSGTTSKQVKEPNAKKKKADHPSSMKDNHPGLLRSSSGSPKIPSPMYGEEIFPIDVLREDEKVRIATMFPFFFRPQGSDIPAAETLVQADLFGGSATSSAVSDHDHGGGGSGFGSNNKLVVDVIGTIQALNTLSTPFGGGSSLALGNTIASIVRDIAPIRSDPKDVDTMASVNTIASIVRETVPVRADPKDVDSKADTMKGIFFTSI